MSDQMTLPGFDAWLTVAERKQLRHTLGIRSDGSGEQRRNFCFSDDDRPNFATCESLAERGLLSRGQIVYGGRLFRVYTATESGIAAVGIEKQKRTAE